mmetsp:Transcript_41733/g.90921  ORF Transcript_41733/g.90921 Transcript_41733/m.90921 type:complete len:209 (-) Transcript_41733:1132-1758(-)
MRDDHDSHVARCHHAVYCFLYHFFTFSIQGTGGLVQQQNLRFPDQSPGNGYSLSLPTAQLHPALPHFCVVALGKFGDKIMGKSSARGFKHLRVIRPFVFRNPIQNVRLDCACKQSRLLAHNCNNTMVIGMPEAPNWLAIQADNSICLLVEALQKGYHCALALATGAHEGNYTSSRNIQRQSPEDLLGGSSGIRETTRFNLNCTRSPGS